MSGLLSIYLSFLLDKISIYLYPGCSSASAWPRRRAGAIHDAYNATAAGVAAASQIHCAVSFLVQVELHEPSLRGALL